MLAIGVAPQPFLAPSERDLARVLGDYRARLAAPPPADAPVLRADALASLGSGRAGGSAAGVASTIATEPASAAGSGAGAAPTDAVEPAAAGGPGSGGSAPGAAGAAEAPR
jgi:hypothetical protein